MVACHPITSCLSCPDWQSNKKKPTGSKPSAEQQPEAEAGSELAAAVADEPVGKRRASGEGIKEASGEGIKEASGDAADAELAPVDIIYSVLADMDSSSSAADAVAPPGVQDVASAAEPAPVAMSVSSERFAPPGVGVPDVVASAAAPASVEPSTVMSVSAARSPVMLMAGPAAAVGSGGGGGGGGGESARFVLRGSLAGGSSSAYSSGALASDRAVALAQELYDLDDFDRSNPLACSEYAGEIHRNYLRQEVGDY